MADQDDVQDWAVSGESTPTVEVPVDVPAPVDELPVAPVETDADEEDTIVDKQGRVRKARHKLGLAREENVPRIRELTRRLRTVERELEAEKTAKQGPQSGPVYSLPSPPAPVNMGLEPEIEQFADRDDPYGSWQRALATYDRKKDAAEVFDQAEQQQFEQARQQVGAYWMNVRSTHQMRLAAAAQANPRVSQVLQSVQVKPPPLLDLSIMLDDDSANVAVFLADRPALLDELTLMTAKQPVTQENVAIMRRLLHQKMAAASSGSVASSQVLPPAPRPPNPLRTAPMTAGDSLPSDGDSLEAHERAFYQRGAGRR